MDGLLDRAQAAMKRGDLRVAADLCKQMLDEDPQNPHGYALMASLFSATGNHEKAFDFSSLAISLDATVAQFHLQQGHVLYSLREFEQALRAFEKAAELLPDLAEPALWAANCLAAMDKFAEAEGWFVKARDSEHTWQNDAFEGSAHMRAGEFEKSAFMLDRLIKEFPDCVEGYVLRAELHSKNKEYVKAKTRLRQALYKDTHHARALFLLGVLLANEDQEKSAAVAAMQAVQLAPTMVENLLLMGYIFARTGDGEAAEKAFAHALSIAPNNALARYEIIYYLLNHGRSKEALHLIRQYNSVSRFELGDKFMSALARGEMLQAIPASFYTFYHDEFAAAFEPWVVSARAGMSARIIKEALLTQPEFSDKTHFSVLDLGCGAGLLLEYLQARAAISVGVDQSAGMLAIAKQGKRYDICFEMDMMEYMQGTEMQFDMVVCAAALRRVGNVQPFFQVVRGAMHEKSVLAVMLAKESSSLAYSLQLTGHYTHNKSYVCDVASAEGFALVLQKECLLPVAHSEPVWHNLLLFKKVTLH